MYMIQVAKIIGTGLATTGLIGAGVGFDNAITMDITIHVVLRGITSCLRLAFTDILKTNKNGLEPGWLGVSFGLRSSYVRIIMTRNI